MSCCWPSLISSSLASFGACVHTDTPAPRTHTDTHSLSCVQLSAKEEGGGRRKKEGRRKGRRRSPTLPQKCLRGEARCRPL